MANSRSGKVAALLVVPAAALVAIVMLVLRVRVQPLTVPPYRFVVAASSAEPTFNAGDKLKLTLEPEGQLTGAIGGHLYLVQGEQVRDVERQPQIEIDRDGTIHLEADASAVFAGVPAGEWDVAIAVGRPEMLPRTPGDALRAPTPGAQGAPWFLVRQRVRYGG